MLSKNFKPSSHHVMLIFLCFSIVEFYGQELKNQNPSSEKVYLSEPEKVIHLRELLAQENPSIRDEYEDRIKQVETLVSIEPFSVVQKTSVAPSGNKKDYLSIGPYWWPDPAKPNGLPWIRKDGEINPKTRNINTDIEAKNEFFKTFKTLAWAAIVTEEDKFIRKTEELIKVWFIDSLTAMNPNLNYAQGIPGLSEGRGFGIIEFAGFSDILMYIEIINHFELLNKKLVADFTNWTEAYANWLQNSELGKFEQSRKNNHGTWYDVQLVSMLLFLDKVDEAKEILEKVKTERITNQIQPDGSQPHELKRTKAFSYSTMNLKAFTKLAYYGKKINVDIWGYTAPNGASLAKAYEFLRPYSENDKEWKYQQITSLEKAKNSFKNLFEKKKRSFPTSSDSTRFQNNTNKIDYDLGF